MSNTWRLVWVQTLTGGREVLERGIPHDEREQRLAEAKRIIPHAPGCKIILEPEDGDEA